MGLIAPDEGAFSENLNNILKKSQSGADVVTNKTPEKPSHTTPGGRKSIVFGGALSKVSPEAPPSSSQHRMPITSRGLSADELMARAVSELRCIEWANLTRELLASSSGGGEAAALFTLPRPVRPGEQVDYFMSHSTQLARRPGHQIRKARDCGRLFSCQERPRPDLLAGQGNRWCGGLSIIPVEPEPR